MTSAKVLQHMWKVFCALLHLMAILICLVMLIPCKNFPTVLPCDRGQSLEGSLLACICLQKRKWNSLKRECYKKFHLALHNVVAWLESLFYFLSSPSFSLMTIESISKRICWKPRSWLMSFFVYPETMMEALIQVLLNTKYILIIYLYLSIYSI